MEREIKVLLLEDEPCVRERIGKIFRSVFSEVFIYHVSRLGDYSKADLSRWDFVLVDRDNATRKWDENGFPTYEPDFHSIFKEYLTATLEINPEYVPDNVLFISGIIDNNLELIHYLSKFYEKTTNSEGKKRIRNRTERIKFETGMKTRIFSKGMTTFGSSLKSFLESWRTRK